MIRAAQDQAGDPPPGGICSHPLMQEATAETDTRRANNFSEGWTFQPPAD
jgi:hypothetical protein